MSAGIRDAYRAQRAVHQQYFGWAPAARDADLRSTRLDFVRVQKNVNGWKFLADLGLDGRVIGYVERPAVHDRDRYPRDTYHAWVGSEHTAESDTLDGLQEALVDAAEKGYLAARAEQLYRTLKQDL